MKKHDSINNRTGRRILENSSIILIELEFYYGNRTLIILI